MKPRSKALRHSLHVFCQMVLIVALGVSCVPFSPAAPISPQPDRASPLVEGSPAVKAALFPAPLPIVARPAAEPAAIAPVDTFQPASLLNSAYARAVDQARVAPSLTRASSVPAVEPPLALPDELIGKPSASPRSWLSARKTARRSIWATANMHWCRTRNPCTIRTRAASGSASTLPLPQENLARRR